jgi:mono/diheme cytochrome c family protein
MKTKLFAFAITLFMAVISCTDNKPNETATTTAPKTTTEDLVKRGEYLVGILGCNDCHSAKRMGAQGPEIIPETMLAGYPADRPLVKFDSKLIKEGFAQFYPDLTAAAGPWGISFAGNLTSDETGIGNWTEEQFKRAMTQGKYKGLETGRMLLPPMPWQNYINITDEDLKAVFAYLKSTKPVKNLVPAPIAPDKM